MIRPRFWVVSCVMLLTAAAMADEPRNDDARNRAAVRKSIPLILKSVTEYARHRDCFSCHHHAVPILAATIARDQGFAVDGDVLDQIVEHTRNDLEGSLESYRAGRGQGGGATRAGYALFTLKSGGTTPDELTAAVAGYLVGREESRPQWRTTSDRPPSEASDFTTTYLAVVALREYGSAVDMKRIDDRIARARTWFESTKGKTTEDQVFRLFGLHATSADPEFIREAVTELRNAQHDDGGWSQLPDIASDAYATGSVLVALHRAGGLSTADAAYRKGLGFLAERQLADGSWHVVSRSKPFQPYFESGFPHGKDQFISMAASSWATAALALGSQEAGEAGSSGPADPPRGP